MKTFLRFVIFTTLISILLSACGGAGKQAQSNRARDKNPNTSTADLQALVDGNNAFALDLYQSLRSKDENLILSPFSISLALSMAYAGARGETESQMADALHFNSQEQTHPAFNALDLMLEDTSMSLDKDQEPMQLSIVNSVWAEQTFTFLPDFLDTLAINYGAGIHLMDFLNNAEAARTEINGWVSAETKEKIPELLSKGMVNSNTKMVLVNAIYFNADWLDAFDADDTHDRYFTRLDGSTVTVPMMKQSMDIRYMAGDGFAAAELLYAGETAAMTIILPDAGRFDEVEAQLNADMLNDILNAMSTQNYFVQMPKLEYESDFLLAGTLSELGMPLAFDPNQADFSGMSDERLFIGDVIHKAFVKVDEKGTEAAAATAVIMEGATAIMIENEFIVDRPYIYFIRDVQSGQILFVGRVLNPQ